MELGKKIAEIRKEHDLTQEGLAEICSVTRQTISNWENGKSCPDLETLVLISDTFDITLDEMLKGDKKMVSMIAAEQKQGRKYKSSKTISAVIAVAAVIAIIIFLIETPWFLKMEYDTVDEKDYSKCLRLVNKAPGVTDVFPKRIPSDAKDIEFHSYVNIGGTLLMLSFTAESSTIDSFIEKAEENAFCFGTKYDHKVGAALPSYKLSPLGQEDLVFVLHSEQKGNYNHAKLVWVVVNEKTQSITFNVDSY